MKKGIIFDLDGTLWDSVVGITDSWNECLVKELKRPELCITQEGMRSACGMTMRAIGDLLFPSLREDEHQMEAVLNRVMEYEVDYLRIHGGEIYPGVEMCLKQLKEMGYHLYIVSNCQKGYIESFLEWSGYGEWVEDTECFGNTLLSKDGSIRLLFERNGLDDAIYVGDTQGDYDSTVKAGLRFVLADYGFGTVNADVPRVESILDLPDLMRGIMPV